MQELGQKNFFGRVKWKYELNSLNRRNFPEIFIVFDGSFNID
jgi:hypothetical protein